MSELALLARETGVDERTLRRAINLGSIRAQRPSPHTLSLSLAERRYVKRSWPLMFRIRGALRTERNLRLAVLFGSSARGTDHPSSDVDVLVELQDAQLERVLDLTAKLSAAAGRPVDLVRLEDAQEQPGFFAEILDEGRVLIDRDGRWPELQRQLRAIRARAHKHRANDLERALSRLDRIFGS